MKTIMLQKIGDAFHPFGPEDEELFSELKPNQVSAWNLQSKGVKKTAVI